MADMEKKLQLIEVKIQDGKVIMGNQNLLGVEHYELRISSELPKGTAELTLKMIVNFSKTE